jgi:hypothetical protein
MSIALDAMAFISLSDTGRYWLSEAQAAPTAEQVCRQDRPEAPHTHATAPVGLMDMLGARVGKADGGGDG